MRRDPGLISQAVDGLDPMQQPFTRRPEFYFFNQSKQFNPFTVEAFSRLFSWFFLCHDVKPNPAAPEMKIEDLIHNGKAVTTGWNL